MLKSESLWTVLCLVIALFMIVLALSNIQEGKTLPAAGCLLLAALFILGPRMIKNILILVLSIAMLTILGIMNAIIEGRLAKIKSLSYEQEVADAETIEDKIYWLLRNGPMCPSYLSVKLSAPVEDIRAILQEWEKQQLVEQVAAAKTEDISDERPWQLQNW